MASNNNIIVVANTLHAEGEKIYNASFAIDRSGRLLARLVENLRHKTLGRLREHASGRRDEFTQPSIGLFPRLYSFEKEYLNG